MAKRTRRKRMDSIAAAKYHRVARALLGSAVDLWEIADDGDVYGNAIAIVAIHSAIAYADTLCIAYAGFKSTEGEHERAADTLSDALGERAEPQELRTFRTIVREKDAVSYQGEYYTITDARTMVERLQAFARWAEEMYERRP